MKLTVCDTKVLYDTEFEAIVAAAKKTHMYGEEMEPYACHGDGMATPHFHLSHAKKEESRGSGKKYDRCPDCNQLLRRKTVQRGHNCKNENSPTGARAVANGAISS